MRISPSVKPGVWGAVLGSIITMILGFGWGGWVTGGTATQTAMQQADAAVVSALVPICMERSKTDGAGAKKLAVLRAMTSSYEQREFVETAGWATMPGSAKPNKEVAEACLARLLKIAEAK